jgi:quercetin dioxygenase-like cupin family protein
MLKASRIDRAAAGEDPSHDPYVARELYFEGEVNVQSLIGPGESDDLELLAVFFEGGARTRPHIHERDQALHFLSGEGIVVSESEELRAAAGDVVLTPAGTWHWHGAVVEGDACHVSIRRPGRTDWNVDERDWTRRR